MRDIGLPNTILTIGNYAYAEDVSLNELVLPDNLTSIGDYAFENLFGLKMLEMPDGVTHIGTSILRGASSLSSLTVTFLGDEYVNSQFDRSCYEYLNPQLHCLYDNVWGFESPNSVYQLLWEISSSMWYNGHAVSSWGGSDSCSDRTDSQGAFCIQVSSQGWYKWCKGRPVRDSSIHKTANGFGKEIGFI